MKKGKKVLSTVVLGCFLMSTAVPAYAAVDAELEKALENTKETLGINTEIWDQFEYSAMQRGDSTHWTLDWRNSQDESRALIVEIDQTGHIYSYRFNVDQAEEGLATVQKAAAQQAAESYLQKIVPDLYPALKPEDTQNNRLAYNGFTFTFRQHADGVPIKDALITVTVDKYTGAVINYQASEAVDFQGESYPDKNKAISATAALDALQEKIGIKMVYRSNYDYKQKTTTVFPVYQIADQSKVIDAMTGEAITLQPNKALYAGSTENAAAQDSGGNGVRAKLTPEELKAVDQLKNIISKEKAYQVCTAALGQAVSGYQLESSELTQIYPQKDRYKWQLGLTKGEDSEQGSIFCSIDAQNGQLLSFSNYSGQDAEALAQPKTRLEAQKDVADFAQKNAPAFLKQCKLVTNPMDKATADHYYFTYERQVNGIGFADNGLSFSYDAKTGQMTNYDLSWDESLVFPAIKEAKSAADIGKKMAEDAKYQLMQVNEKAENRLIYDFSDQSALYYDAISGNRVNWQGRPYQSNQTPVYQGLEGQACAAAAQTLLDNGIYLDQSQLNPAKTITQQELLTMLLRMNAPYANFEDSTQLYEQAQSSKIISKEESQADKLMSRQECAKYIVRFMHYDQLAKNSAMFAYPYQDSVEADYKGYVAIVAGLGIISADQNQKINPMGNVTISDLFTMIYKMATLR